MSNSSVGVTNIKENGNSHVITIERGAVTVDWVVLTAGLVGLGFAVAGVVSIGVQDTSGDIKGQLESDDIIQSAFSFAALMTSDTNGNLSFSSGGRTSTGTFNAAGGLHTDTQPNEIQLYDASESNGTHSIDMNEPLLNLTVSMLSVNDNQNITNVTAILEDGTRVSVTSDHYTTGTNPLDASTSFDANGKSAGIITDNAGTPVFNGHNWGDSEFSFTFNASNTPGLNSSNGIVGFEYEQNSPLSNTGRYAVFAEGTPF